MKLSKWWGHMHDLLCPRPFSTRSNWKLHTKKWTRQGSTWPSRAWRMGPVGWKSFSVQWIVHIWLGSQIFGCLSWRVSGNKALLTRISGTEWAFPLLLYCRHLEGTATIHCHICRRGFVALSLPLHMLMTWFQSYFGSEFPVLCNQMENQWVPKVSSTSKCHGLMSKYCGYQCHSQMVLGSSQHISIWQPFRCWS